MKNQLWLLLALLLTMIHVQGQNVTKSFTWQGIIKDSTGQPLDNQTIDIQIGIWVGMEGSLVYRETHEVTTSSTGHISIEVGNGESNAFTTFEKIDWTTNNLFQKVGIDTVGNGNFQTIGTTPIRPIPLAIDVLNKNESIHVVNAESGRYIDLEEKDIVHVEGDISVTDEMRFYDQYLYIYGGNFTGTTGNDELRFGNYTIIKNAHFNNIKLSGNSITFENCHFSGDIEFPHGATLINCTLESVTTSSVTSIGILQNSSIRNSNLLRVTRFLKNDIINSIVGEEGLSYFCENYASNCKIHANNSDVSITNNQFYKTKINASIKAFYGLNIANNTFDDVYPNETEVIKIDVNNNYLRLYKIVDNVFKVQSNTARSIYVTGNTSSLPILDISNNTFYEGAKAISYSSNIRTTIKNNTTSRTSLGVANNNNNLRVLYNIVF